MFYTDVASCAESSRQAHKEGPYDKHTCPHCGTWNHPESNVMGPADQQCCTFCRGVWTLPEEDEECVSDR